MTHSHARRCSWHSVAWLQGHQELLSLANCSGHCPNVHSGGPCALQVPGADCHSCGSPPARSAPHRRLCKGSPLQRLAALRTAYDTCLTAPQSRHFRAPAAKEESSRECMSADPLRQRLCCSGYEACSPSSMPSATLFGVFIMNALAFQMSMACAWLNAGIK